MLHYGKALEWRPSGTRVLRNGASLAAMNPGSVLIIDPHPAMRSAIADALVRCGFRCSESSAPAQMPTAGFDVVVHELVFGEGRPHEVLQQVKSNAGSAARVVFTARDDALAQRLSKLYGARGFVSKTAPTQRLLIAVVQAHRGAKDFPRRPSPAAPLPLSQRQREIAELASEGLSNREIASCLGLREGTIKAHLSAAFRVLGVRNRTQLTRCVRP